MKIATGLCLMIYMITSCSNSGCTKLEFSLRFAGKNREELEKVLSHYSKNNEDSLKFEAACFLIENMYHYYSMQSEKLELYKSKIYLLSINNNWSPDRSYQFLKKKYGELYFYDYKKVYDSHVITADYLIHNIDYSFDVWLKNSWGKNLSFNDFCEEILPYRIGNEPLENWKEKYHEYFSPILDSLSEKNDPVKVYKVILEEVLKKKWLFTQNLNIPHIGACTLLENHIGYCRDICDLGVYIMRSVGIPGGIDFIIQNADDMYGEHSWNYITDTTGHCIEVDMINVYEGVIRQRKKGRVYRKCFAKQPDTLKSYYDIKTPLTDLYNSFMRDVSNFYFPPNKILISTVGYNIENEIVYLGVFNNKKWIPITGSKINSNQVTFQCLDTTVMYMPLYYSGNDFVPFGKPFNMQSDDFVFFPKANHQNLQDMLLLRKHKIPHWWTRFGNRCLFGRFQGANEPDFSDAQDLYIIDTLLTMNYYYVSINSENKFQYVRYLSGLNGYNNMAEMAFWGTDKSKRLTGEIIGMEGAFNNVSERTKNAVFDNDPITFYDAIEEDGAWVGLKFNTPQSIKTIIFLFRNDDNNIRIGDEYELFYLDGDCKWKSMGKKVAKDVKLIYHNVPTNALYILRNYTRGKEERIFTYESNQQIWW